jgi:ketosteroid isomerase-like protein
MGNDDAAGVVASFWAAMNTNDFAAAAGHFSEEYVLEWPQSGERIRGRDAFARVNERYPAAGPWRFALEALLTEGDQVVSVVTVTDGALVARAITFSTVRDGRIARQVEYWPDPFDPPAWRAAWVDHGPRGW